MMFLLDKKLIIPIIAAALKEDIGARDVTTSALILKNEKAEAEIVVRQEGIIAGMNIIEWVFNNVSSEIRFKPAVEDGTHVYPDKVVAYLEGPARGILMGERTALNFLGRLSGISTLTRSFVDRVSHWPEGRGVASSSHSRFKTKIYATRKTTPTLRALEKYAVTVGGGTAHRMGLYDGVLIKDNHLELIARRLSALAAEEVSDAHRMTAVEEAVREARSKAPKNFPIEIEVRNLQEFRQALSAQADIILLDNMKISDIQEAVRLRNAVIRSKSAGPVILEVSGGVTLDTVEKIAAAGVDRISIGALTHSAPALNIALEVVG